ncbi:ATP-binding protein [Pseudoduganella sp. LjRoot289]|uniref:sensor histidine kinase n=1 Tax=Pseudoduganella sp. LjRoot289 TaxID=3342314 RepID=UPI003ECD21A6
MKQAAGARRALPRLPRLRSFRLRVALVSTLTALAAITALYIAASVTIVSRRAAIIDRMLSAQLSGPMLQTAPQAPWSAVDAQLNANFSGFAPAGTTEGYAILRVVHADGSELYRSSNWPRELVKATQPAQAAQPAPAAHALHTTGASPLSAPAPSGQPATPQAALAAATLQTVDGAGQSWRIGSTGNGPLTVWVGVNRSLSNAQVRASLGRFGAAVVGLVALIGLLSWYLAGRAMRPIEHLTGVIVRVNAADLGQRVSAAEEDREFAQLVIVFNAMLDRLERSFMQAARFSGDAAHELKTPLTILQGELERSFARAEGDPALEQGLANMLDEVRRLDSIVKKLLLLARADAGQLAIPLCPVDLRPMLDGLAEDIELMDDSRPVRLQLPSGIPVRGDADLLRQVLHNLVSNAIKYGIPGGWIALAARAGDGNWQIDISNASDGIPSEHWDRLFDRFYRADHAHNRRVPGVGLGLALARDIVQAHGGALHLADGGPGQVRFRLTLPAVS